MDLFWAHHCNFTQWRKTWSNWLSHIIIQCPLPTPDIKLHYNWALKCSQGGCFSLQMIPFLQIDILKKNLFYFNSNRSNSISIEACLSLVIGVTNSSKNFTVTYTGHSKWKKGWWKDKNENFFTHNNLIVKSCVLYYFIFSQSNGLIILNNLGCCRI